MKLFNVILMAAVGLGGAFPVLAGDWRPTISPSNHDEEQRKASDDIPQ